MNHDLFAERIRACWSSRSATAFSDENPARGQCSVTALLAQEELGGELLKTKVGDGWHFYNRIGGARVDFTSDQFGRPIHYDDELATHAETMRDTSPQQLAVLRRSFEDRPA